MKKRRLRHERGKDKDPEHPPISNDDGGVYRRSVFGSLSRLTLWSLWVHLIVSVNHRSTTTTITATASAIAKMGKSY